MSHAYIGLQVNVSLCCDAESAPLPRMLILVIWHPHVWNQLGFPTVICAQSPLSTVHKIMACLYATAPGSLALSLRVDYKYRLMWHLDCTLWWQKIVSPFSNQLMLDCHGQCVVLLYILSENMRFRCSAFRSISKFRPFACTANIQFRSWLSCSPYLLRSCDVYIN